MAWILDFDDTLAMGPNTWAFQVVLPDLIKTHQLPYKKDKFDAVMLNAQKQANEGVSEADLLDAIFTALGWSKDVQSEMMHRVFNTYSPDLFDDAVPFLKRLKQRGDTLYVISNNDPAPALLAKLGIADYFADVLTPSSTDTKPKPAADMWQHLQKKHTLNADKVSMVGDDPWSDGSFAQAANLRATYIVDRLGRYKSLHETLPYHFVHTLADILVSD